MPQGISAVRSTNGLCLYLLEEEKTKLSRKLRNFEIIKKRNKIENKKMYNLLINVILRCVRVAVVALEK